MAEWSTHVRLFFSLSKFDSMILVRLPSKTFNDNNIDNNDDNSNNYKKKITTTIIII